MAHTADPLNSTPLNPTAGDQGASNEVSRELLDQLASTFRPSWELDAASFSGPGDLSSGEIQALQSGGGTAPELRGEAHASIGPLPPPQATELSEPTESIIIQGTPAPQISAFAAQAPSSDATEVSIPSPIMLGTAPAGLPEDTVADMAAPLLHERASAPVSSTSFHQRPGPIVVPPDEAPPPPPRAASFRPPAPAAEEGLRRSSVRPPASPAEEPVPMPSTRPVAWAGATPVATRFPSRPPLPSVDLGELPAFTRRSKTPLWIAIGLAAAALIATSFWVFGGSAPAASMTSATPPAAEIPPPAPPKSPPRTESQPEVPSPPQPNPLAAPPPAFPTAAAAEPPAPPPTPAYVPPAASPPPPAAAAARPVQRSAPTPAPRPTAHPKAGNTTIVRDVPF